jgi:pimeloyl-ACP methyl ester carboxylesterase
VSHEPASIRLPDGRSLSYYDLGDPQGRPVLLFHGSPGAAIGWLFADGPARELGVRAIAPDRPGIGASSFQARRRLLDYPDDVAALADQLGIERFAVLGWSAGGPYALACAARLPERVTAAGCAAGASPLDGPGALDDLNAQDRRIVKLGRRSPGAVRALLAASAAAVRHAPGLTERWSAAQLSVAEREELRRHEAALGDRRFFLDAFQQGARGVTEDYRIYGEPWGFDLAEIRVPVTLWNGDADSLVPLRHAQLLAERIPGATLEVVPGAGHLLPYDQIGVELRALTSG